MRTKGKNFLQAARRNKKDEFYTREEDIEKELSFYKEVFINKTVFCNCDDPRESHFGKYFIKHFSDLGLKKLIVSGYTLQSLSKENPSGKVLLYDGKSIVSQDTDGDFRSKESRSFLEEADIAVTNPPFSLFREYFSLIIESKKKFLLIANINAITYKEVFPRIQQNEVWLGVHMGRGISGFLIPKEYPLYGSEGSVLENEEVLLSPNNCLWLTNLSHAKRREFLSLQSTYLGNEKSYPKYDNYEAIHLSRTKDIPVDYDGVIGVPITFLHKYNPDQFEIVGFRKGSDGKDLRVHGKTPYFRILIRRKVF